MSWKNYDYGAVTAGTILCIMGAIVFASTPRLSLQCSRAEQRCAVVASSLRSTDRRTFALSSIEKARKECDRSKSKSCAWSVRLVVKGDSGEVFSGVDSEQEAERYVQAIRDFLDGRGSATLTLTRPPDRSWVWGLFGVGLVLVVLGIRKNLVDKRVL
jgi:hypothetical protein